VTARWAGFRDDRADVVVPGEGTQAAAGVAHRRPLFAQPPTNPGARRLPTAVSFFGENRPSRTGSAARRVQSPARRAGGPVWSRSAPAWSGRRPRLGPRRTASLSTSAANDSSAYTAEISPQSPGERGMAASIPPTPSILAPSAPALNARPAPPGEQARPDNGVFACALDRRRGIHHGLGERVQLFGRQDVQHAVPAHDHVGHGDLSSNTYRSLSTIMPGMCRMASCPFSSRWPSARNFSRKPLFADHQTQ
jgi:hypothetical protein